MGLLLIFFIFSMLTLEVSADPEQDRLQWLDHYHQLFPELKLPDYANGVYAIDPIAKESWLAIEEFPPYELALEKGEALYKKPFKNGHRYADCLPNKGMGIAQEYPKWEAGRGEVVTLAQTVNKCRAQQGEAVLSYQKGEIADLLAYLAFTSRGNSIKITVPESDIQALAAFEQGKQYYYQRRGQLNFSCATCHIQNAGKQLRSEILSPALGHTSNWPAYRLKWGEMGTLHRRFIECHQQMRAPVPEAQSAELRHLEYFLSYMGNGIPLNAPSTRK